MIKFLFANRSDLRLVKRVKDTGPALLREIKITMNKIIFGMASYIVETKLSQKGPTTLGNVTGNLRTGVMSSAHVEESGASIVGIIGIPQEVKYGVYQELGAHIPEVLNTLMVFQGAEGTVFTQRHRAFDLPERSFLRSTLAEKQGWIGEQLDDAVRRAIAITE